MALFDCTECGKQISDKALACPHCGMSITKKSDNSVSSNNVNVNVGSNINVNMNNATLVNDGQDKKGRLSIKYNVMLALLFTAIVIVLVISIKFKTDKSSFIFPIKHKSLEKGELVGAIDVKGNIILEPSNRYKTSIYYPIQLLPIAVDGKYGYVDVSGKFIIEPQFDSAREFKNGFAGVSVDGKYGIVSSSGKVKLFDNNITMEPKYFDKFAIVQVQNKQSTYQFDYGVIDYEGNYIINPSDTYITDYSEGLFVTKQKNNKYGYIDIKGNTVIEHKYDQANIFHQGLARVHIGNENCIYIDKKGYQTILLDSSIATECSDVNDGLITITSNDKKGFVDKQGKVVIEPKYVTSSEYFSEELLPVNINGKWGYINKYDKVVIDPQFESAGIFKNGLASVSINGKDGLINKKGKYIIKPEYDSIRYMGHGLADVTRNGTPHYVNLKNKIVWTQIKDKVLNSTVKFKDRTVKLDDGNYDSESGLHSFIMYNRNGDNDIDYVAAKTEFQNIGFNGYWSDSLCMFKYNGAVLVETDCDDIIAEGMWPPRIQSINVTNSRIAVQILNYGPDDPHCCPSVKKEIGYSYQNNKLSRLDLPKANIINVNTISMRHRTISENRTSSINISDSNVKYSTESYDGEEEAKLVAINYFKAVEESRIDDAVNLYTTVKRPTVKRKTLELAAKNTLKYTIESFSYKYIPDSNATLKIILNHKMRKGRPEYWEITINLVKEGTEWRIVSTPGKFIKYG